MDAFFWRHYVRPFTIFSANDREAAARNGQHPGGPATALLRLGLLLLLTPLVAKRNSQTARLLPQGCRGALQGFRNIFDGGFAFRVLPQFPLILCGPLPTYNTLPAIPAALSHSSPLKVDCVETSNSRVSFSQTFISMTGRLISEVVFSGELSVCPC